MNLVHYACLKNDGEKGDMEEKYKLNELMSTIDRMSLAHTRLLIYFYSMRIDVDILFPHCDV